MTKNELIAAIAEETGKTKADVSAILASLGTTVAKTLKKGDDVTLGGIGKLSAAKREAREARNPSTGATIKVPAPRTSPTRWRKAIIGIERRSRMKRGRCLSLVVMLGLDPSISSTRFSGLRCAPPENDAVSCSFASSPICAPPRSP